MNSHQHLLNENIPTLTINNQGELRYSRLLNDQIFKPHQIIELLNNILGTSGRFDINFNGCNYKIYYIYKKSGEYELFFFDKTHYPELSEVLDTNTLEEIIYDEDMLTGIEFMDTEHSNLMEIINELIRSVKSKDKLEVTLGYFFTLNDKFTQHIQREEKIIKDFNIVNEDQHIEDHYRLKKQLELVLGNITIENLASSVDFLKRWLRDHIILYDKPLAKILRALDYR